MFENRVLGIIFGCMGHEATEAGNSIIIRDFIICILPHVLLG
jgi:hypothetical protein